MEDTPIKPSWLHTQLNTVTSFSKVLAAIIFISLPLLAFWFGYTYQAPQEATYVPLNHVAIIESETVFGERAKYSLEYFNISDGYWWPTESRLVSFDENGHNREVEIENMKIVIPELLESNSNVLSLEHEGANSKFLYFAISRESSDSGVTNLYKYDTHFKSTSIASITPYYPRWANGEKYQSPDGKYLISSQGADYTDKTLRLLDFDTDTATDLVSIAEDETFLGACGGMGEFPDIDWLSTSTIRYAVFSSTDCTETGAQGLLLPKLIEYRTQFITGQ